MNISKVLVLGFGMAMSLAHAAPSDVNLQTLLESSKAIKIENGGDLSYFPEFKGKSFSEILAMQLLTPTIEVEGEQLHSKNEIRNNCMRTRLAGVVQCDLAIIRYYYATSARGDEIPNAEGEGFATVIRYQVKTTRSRSNKTTRSIVGNRVRFLFAG